MNTWFETVTISGYTAIREHGEEDPIAWVDFVKKEDFNLALAAPKMLELIEMIAEEGQKEGFSMKVWVAAAQSVAAQAKGE